MRRLLCTSAASLGEQLSSACAAHAAAGGRLHWVFLGAPGVGKGTYASRVAKLAGVPHVSAGDLVRDEIRKGGPDAARLQDVTSRGALLPDALVLALLRRRLAAGEAAGERGVLLDGFPRTAAQAAALDAELTVHAALNLTLREDVLVAKCTGRRVCGECGRGYNVADIAAPADPSLGLPAVLMPPLPPPPGCAAKMTTRADDTEAVVRARLAVYREQCGPVEAHYAASGRLRHFAIAGGIPETLPALLGLVLGMVRAQQGGGAQQLQGGKA